MHVHDQAIDFKIQVDKALTVNNIFCVLFRLDYYMQFVDFLITYGGFQNSKTL